MRSVALHCSNQKGVRSFLKIPTAIFMSRVGSDLRNGESLFLQAVHGILEFFGTDRAGSAAAGGHDLNADGSAHGTAFAGTSFHRCSLSAGYESLALPGILLGFQSITGTPCTRRASKSGQPEAA